MIIIGDNFGLDRTRSQAMGHTNEGILLLDYVEITQVDGGYWMAQIIEPNLNIFVMGDRLDAMVRHGLKLQQEHPEDKPLPAEIVQIFDLLLLGQKFSDGQVLGYRARPLPGAQVKKLDKEKTRMFLRLPSLISYADKTRNCIGVLRNADGVPLCIDKRTIEHHIMVCGGTGSGKSNVAANVDAQALKMGKCVFLHDAKPDYRLAHKPNTDASVEPIWRMFETYGMKPYAPPNVKKVGFYGLCNPHAVDTCVSCRASDLSPSMLGSMFFTGGNDAENTAFENFVATVDTLRFDRGNKPYSLDDIIEEIEKRIKSGLIHEKTGPSMLGKIGRRRKGMKWLDKVGQSYGNGATSNKGRFSYSLVEREQTQKTVESFDLESLIQPGRLIIIDYGDMEDDAYALLLSYFLGICHKYRKRDKNNPVEIMHHIEEAHRVFDNGSRHGKALSNNFARIMREGRTKAHSMQVSLQNASQIHHHVMNNLNSKVVMTQKSREEAVAATQTMGKDFVDHAMNLGIGEALVDLLESRATVLAQMAPSPFELMRADNMNNADFQPSDEIGVDYDF